MVMIGRGRQDFLSASIVLGWQKVHLDFFFSIRKAQMNFLGNPILFLGLRGDDMSILIW